MRRKCKQTGQSVEHIRSCYAGEATVAKSDKFTSTAAAVTRTPVVSDGMYEREGTIYKVQRAVHGSGYLYAKVLTLHETADGKTKGTFEFEQGAIRKIAAQDKISLEDAKVFGRLYGVCCKCGATLTDDSEGGSIEAGIGPICSGKGWA